MHNHETIGDLLGHWTTTVGDYDRRFEYVSTLLNLKIPRQIVQVCVKSRYSLRTAKWSVLRTIRIIDGSGGYSQNATETPKYL